MLRTETINFRYQNTISEPPKAPTEMYRQACTGDAVTVNTWFHTWVENFSSAKKKFGNLGDHSVGKLHGTNKNKPAIVIGSGPSLKNALPKLKTVKDILTISCAHNFAYFEDNAEGWHPDYYLSLDAGPIIFDDICEGKQEREHYWAATKGKKLLAYVCSDSRLWDLWQGEIFLFNALIPDEKFRTEIEKIERFAHYVSSGGNALGACMYVAKAIMGSNPIIYTGADFCFSYDDKFHAWDSKYDATGTVIRCTDVYGFPRITWPSYWNFKHWFDYISLTVPGTWINCSDGTLGAYPEGNLSSFTYKSLPDALLQFEINERVYLEAKDSNGKVLSKNEINLKEVFADPTYKENIVLF